MKFSINFSWYMRTTAKPGLRTVPAAACVQKLSSFSATESKSGRDGNWDHMKLQREEVQDITKCTLNFFPQKLMSIIKTTYSLNLHMATKLPRKWSDSFSQTDIIQYLGKITSSQRLHRHLLVFSHVTFCKDCSFMWKDRTALCILLFSAHINPLVSRAIN